MVPPVKSFARYIGFYTLHRQQNRFMPQGGDFSRPIMGTTARFHADACRWQPDAACASKLASVAKLTDYQRQEALARRQSGEPLVDIGRSYGVSPQHHF